MTDNKRKMHAVYNPPRADDINYPGDGGDMTQRQTSRATVTYDTYVLDYAARQRANVLMSAAGIAAGVGAAIYLDGGLMVFVIVAAVKDAAAPFIKAGAVPVTVGEQFAGLNVNGGNSYVRCRGED